MLDLTTPLEGLSDPLPVAPLEKPFDAGIRVPGSKSLTCRAYVLAALAEGESQIRRPLVADDTEGLLEALRELGAGVSRVGDDVVISGVGGRFPRGGEINLGDGGAPTRFMIAAATLASDAVVVDGSARMRQRPVAEGVELLRRLGADIEYVEDDGRLPVRVSPAPLRGGVLEVPTTLSSQFVSALMLVGPFLPGGLELAFSGEVTSSAYVVLTAKSLSDWNVAVKAKLPRIAVAPGGVAGRGCDIEPDASSAAYWMIAAALVPGSRVLLADMPWPTAQPDANVLTPLRGVGVEAAAADGGLAVRGPARPRWALDCDARRMPDAAVALAAACAAGDGRSVIRGLRTLRVKETDRIAALATELRKIGCTVETTDDSVAVEPPPGRGADAVIDTYGDHRMVMAFAVLGLARAGIAVAEPGCVSKSYPGFWSDLSRLYD